MPEYNYPGYSPTQDNMLTARPHTVDGYHGGNDNPAPAHTPVYAEYPGTVVRSGNINGYGLAVVVESVAPNGTHFFENYAHLAPVLKSMAPDGTISYEFPIQLHPDPLDPTDLPAPGTKVTTGQQIPGAFIGTKEDVTSRGGDSSGPHLHREIISPHAPLNLEPNQRFGIQSSDITFKANPDTFDINNPIFPYEHGPKPAPVPAGHSGPSKLPAAPPPSVGGKPLTQPSNTPVQSEGGQSSKVGPPVDLWAIGHPGNEPNPYHGPTGSTAPPPSPPPEGSYPVPRGLYYDEPAPTPNGFPYVLPGAGQSPPPPSNISVDAQIGNEGQDGTTASPGQTLTPQAWAARKMGATVPSPSVPSPGAAPPPPAAPASAIPPQPAPIFAPQPAVAPAPPPPAFAQIPAMALPIFAPPRKPIDLSVLGTMLVNRAPIFPGQG
jgi:murein DD-endopeptidase MepM/ murein hydrolase activator NlpD